MTAVETKQSSSRLAGPEPAAADRAGLPDPHLQKEPVPWKRKQSDPQIPVYIAESPLDDCAEQPSEIHY